MARVGGRWRRLRRNGSKNPFNDFNGGPVGVEALAAAVQEEKPTLEDVYEPFLLQFGYLDRTARGRQVTAKAFQHFGKTKDLFG